MARDAKTILDLDINTTYACLSGTTKSIVIRYTDSVFLTAISTGSRSSSKRRSTG
ncbi:MAG TPA: hypothetical protein PLI43_17670 [Albidovulum sp.]|uniref:hypothetical protein n=1 Tax=Albidovulum sp. TaxID=1872424 RepID=UPI002C1E43F1|nr:hypothetical protein [Albidovulum sp.]